MRVLVTGANGFVGTHVARYLSEKGDTACRFDLQPAPDADPGCMWTGDICDPGCVDRVVAACKPDACLHLAGIAFVPIGWQNPQLMYQTNLLGTVNLLEAFRKHAPDARIVVVTSGEIYGRYEALHPLREEDPLHPANPYAIAKQAADQHALLCAERYNMAVMTARPDNHIGPGQSDLFVTSSFARQLAAIAAGTAPAVMRVGNLDTMRNFSDVRDVVRAYRLILNSGVAGQAYNIASGKPIRVRHILDTLCRIAQVAPQIEVDPARYRPTDCLPTLDTTRVRALGWRPEIPLDTTLLDIYADARRSVAS